VQSRHRNLLILATSWFAVIMFLLFGPESRTSDSYSRIREVLSRTPEVKVLEISPDLNARYFPWINPVPVSFQSVDPAKNDPRFMRAASLGVEELSKFLTNEGITHLLIANTGQESDRIFFRWGLGPSVDVVLEEPLFRAVAVAHGEYPATLYEVEQVELDGFCSECQGVRLEWEGVRESAINTSRHGYVDGPGIVWILGQDQPSLRLMSSVDSGFKYRVTFGVIAAYGDNAPPQILKFQTEEGVQFERIVGGPSREISVEVGLGEELEIQSVLPCMVPAIAQLEAGNQDTRELCFGVSSIKVEEIK
jgi:hypothetical protein